MQPKRYKASPKRIPDAIEPPTCSHSDVVIRYETKMVNQGGLRTIQYKVITCVYCKNALQYKPV